MDIRKTIVRTHGRRRTRYVAQVGSLEATGATAAEARAALSAAIETALTGSYTPIMIHYQGHWALVWREPTGWYYTLSVTSRTGKYLYGVQVNGVTTATEAERLARRHLADLLSTPEQPCLDLLEIEDDRQQLLARLAWQRRYQDYRRQGYSEMQAHQLASGYQPAPPATAHADHISAR